MLLHLKSPGAADKEARLEGYKLAFSCARQDVPVYGLKEQPNEHCRVSLVKLVRASSSAEPTGKARGACI